MPKRSAVLQKLHSLNQGDVVLNESGRNIPVGLSLIPLSEAMDVGVLPTAVADEVLKKQAEGGQFTEEELSQLGAATLEDGNASGKMREFAARCIRTLWGEPVGQMTGEDTKQFTDAEFAALLAYCTRQTPLPGKD